MTPETLRSIADRWAAHMTRTTDVPDLVEEIVRQAEQIKRLREALIYFMSNEFVRDQPLHVMTDKAQAILKETDPQG